ncbi:MAG: OmpA family protein [Chitinophagaceae bacterium]|nr:OmpA family protein [Chitinophagaceae bacterium]
MKKIFLLLLIVAFSATVNAQTADKKWGLGIGVGAYGPIENNDFGYIPELYLGRYISPRFDLMLQGNLGILRTGMENTLDVGNPLLNVRYKFYNETRKFRPYIYAGPGYLYDNMKTGVNFDLGLGAKHYNSSTGAFYGSAGYVSGIEVEGETENLWKVTLGWEFSFGKSKDSDKDGVPDKKDKCPDTPAGVAVDDKGCPSDTDGDGMADDKDDCPTVAGIPALKGCPDADEDGVADKNDKCPDTKKGVKVDASGCPSDQDKDGVIDSEDACPTVAGTKENKGCPAKAVEPVKVVEKVVEKQPEVKAEEIELQDIEVAAIHFVSGKSYITEYSGGLLDKLITLLNQNKAYNVNVYGYADNQGSDETNIELSKERVDSTIKYLQSKGIASNRIIQQEAFGEAKPVATNDTPEGRLLNRRVEFEIFIMK